MANGTHCKFYQAVSYFRLSWDKIDDVMRIKTIQIIVIFNMDCFRCVSLYMHVDWIALKSKLLPLWCPYDISWYIVDAERNDGAIVCIID